MFFVKRHINEVGNAAAQSVIPGPDPESDEEKILNDFYALVTYRN